MSNHRPLASGPAPSWRNGGNQYQPFFIFLTFFLVESGLAAIFFVVSAIFAAGAIAGFAAGAAVDGAAIAGAAIAGAAAGLAVFAGGCAEAVLAITSVVVAMTRRIRFTQKLRGESNKNVLSKESAEHE